MQHTIELEGLESGTFERDKQTFTYLRLRGRDMNGRYVRAIAYTPVAEVLKEQIEKRLLPGEDVAQHRFMLQLVGEWKERRVEGQPRPQRSFQFREYEFLQGPSVELKRHVRDGNVALQSAAASLKTNDIPQAYRVLEAFVAKLTGQPAPSIDHEDLFDVDPSLEGQVDLTGTNPEAEAMARLKAFDSRNAMPNAVESKDVVFTAPAAVAEAPVETIEADDDQQLAQADAPLPSEGDVAFEPEAEVPAIEPASAPDAPEPAQAEASEEPAVASEPEPVAEPTAAIGNAPEAAPAASGASNVRRPAFSKPPSLPKTASAPAPAVEAEEIPAQPNRPASVPRRQGFGFARR